MDNPNRFRKQPQKNSCVYNPSDLVEVVVTEVAGSTQGPLQWQAASNKLLTSAPYYLLDGFNR